MKKLLKLSLLITAFLLGLSAGAFADEDVDQKGRTQAPGVDVNEAVSPDGSGVANLGCPDPSKSCYKRLVQGRVGDNTVTRTTGGSKAKEGGVKPAEGRK